MKNKYTVKKLKKYILVFEDSKIKFFFCKGCENLTSYYEIWKPKKQDVSIYNMVPTIPRCLKCKIPIISLNEQKKISEEDISKDLLVKIITHDLIRN